MIIITLCWILIERRGNHLSSIHLHEMIIELKIYWSLSSWWNNIWIIHWVVVFLLYLNLSLFVNSYIFIFRSRALNVFKHKDVTCDASVERLSPCTINIFNTNLIPNELWGENYLLWPLFIQIPYFKRRFLWITCVTHIDWSVMLPCLYLFYIYSLISLMSCWEVIYVG